MEEDTTEEGAAQAAASLHPLHHHLHLQAPHLSPSPVEVEKMKL